MFSERPSLASSQQRMLPLARRSNRPALTQLVLLAIANPSLAEQLLRDNDVANAHPHYGVVLDERDQATLDSIRNRAHSLDEFLANLADAADDMAVYADITP
jgi:uncharacterized protein (DUF302 family)